MAAGLHVAEIELERVVRHFVDDDSVLQRMQEDVRAGSKTRAGALPGE